VRIQAKRWVLLGSALTVIAVSLAACSAGVAGSPTSNVPSNISFVTPDSAQNTPTPTFPLFTIGAWPSDYSPNVNDTITIYVICRVQDPSMQNPPVPPTTPVPVTVILDGPIHDTLQGTTDSDGIAAIPYVVNDPYVGQPVDITVTATYSNTPYIARTFFTTGVSTAPTATSKPGSTAGPTPTNTP
jgi:hypothetical protein